MVYVFFNDTATTEIYTLSLHDALPISPHLGAGQLAEALQAARAIRDEAFRAVPLGVLAPHLEAGQRRAVLAEALRAARSEEHTSELQSRQYLVCRLLLEEQKHSVALRR